MKTSSFLFSFHACYLRVSAVGNKGYIIYDIVRWKLSIPENLVNRFIWNSSMFQPHEKKVNCIS